MVPREQERHRQRDLGLEPVRLHDLAAGEEVVQLVGAAQLDVRLDRDRVIGLHERIEELRHGDRLLRRVPGGEVVALEQARDGHDPRQPDDVGKAELGEPLAVVAHFGPLGIEDLHRLVDVRMGVRLDLLVRQHGAFGGAAGRITDPGRVVADDQDAGVAGVLECAHPLQRDAPADVDVRRSDVDAELDAQRTTERKLALQAALGKDVDSVSRQLLDLASHGGRF